MSWAAARLTSPAGQPGYSQIFSLSGGKNWHFLGQIISSFQPASSLPSRNIFLGTLLWCRDGTCIPLGNLCDLVADCPDKSDEKDCQQLVLPSDYRGEKFPILDTREPLGVFVNISVLSFPDIDTLQSTYLVDFIISMRWNDPRLTFKNLKPIYYLNAIPFYVVEKMWVPEMSMPNALQAEGTIVDNGASLMILKDGRSLPDDLSVAREGKVYLGSECPIVNKESCQLKYF